MAKEVTQKAEKEKTEKAAPEAKAAPVAEKGAPASPDADPAFQAVVHHTRAVAKHQATHAPAHAKAAEAHAAAVSPPNEVSSQAAAKQADRMDQQQPKAFDRAAFKAALLKKIAETTPKTLGEADDFKKSGKLEGVKSDLGAKVSEQKQQSQGDLAQATAEKPDTSGIEPKPVTPLPAAETGNAPQVAATGAAPKPQSDATISLQAGPKEVDKQMTDAGVTEEQIKHSNEPAFEGALAQKKAAEQESVQAPQDFRKQEQGMLTAARADAQATASKEVSAMHGARRSALVGATGHQAESKAEEEKKRADVAAHIEQIYQHTKDEVTKRLQRLDDDVNKTFDEGATAAQKAFEDYVDKRMYDYKLNRYLLTVGGSLLWAKDKLLGMPDEVNVFYQEGHDRYVAQMDGVIDRIAVMVETGLNEAKGTIAQGKKEIQTYVQGLPAGLQEVGKKAATSIQTKFDALEQSVSDKQGQLIDGLAKKYNDNLGKINSRIEEMKAENRGLVDATKDAIKGVIQTIIDLKNMLLGVFQRAADAINLVIADPIGFLGHLIDAGKLGFNNFVDHIAEHLKKGFMEWLFGAVAETGITLPEHFDLPGILSLVLQILGLTYANIRSRAVRILGEKVVKALETAAEIFKILITKGPAGLWEYIKEKIGDLKAMVIDKIKSFVMEKIVVAGITWLIGLLNPASAFIKACKAIYDIIMFFVEHGKQIIDLVNAIIDSITSIAKGAIAAAAAFVERSLAKTIPVVIGFLAALLGVGGISEKIKEIINAIREPINAAIDWVINKAVEIVKAIGGMLGFGKEPKPDDKKPEGAIDVPVSMDEASHELIVTPGPEPAIVLSSPDAKQMSDKIASALKKLGEDAAGNAKQIEALEKLDAKRNALKDLLKDPKKEEEAKKAAAELGVQIFNYAAKYKVKDLDEVSGLFPTPKHGNYGDLTNEAASEPKLPDKKIREAHHAPQVQFAKSLVSELRVVGKVLTQQNDPDTAESFKGAAEDFNGVTNENDLPAILVHQDTHRTHGGGSRIHGSEIRGELEAFLKEKKIDLSTVATTASDEIAVKPGAATYQRTVRTVASDIGKEKSFSRSMKAKGSEIIQTVYDAERERSLGAVEIAVEGSKVDGPDEKKPKALSDFRAYATKAWNGFIKTIKDRLGGT